MGVFLFCNRVIGTERVEEVFRTRGHKVVKKESYENMTLLHAPKILVENVNFLNAEALTGEEGDFIMGVGIYFYKGLTREAALQNIYENIESILKENSIYGHWAFVIRKKGRTYILNDMTGSERLYYIINGDQITVSNSMLAVVATLNQPIFDKVRLAGYLTSKYAKEIPFVKGVEIFNPLTYLTIQDGQPKWVNRSCPKDDLKRIESTTDAVNYVKNLFEEQIEQIKAIGNEPISAELTAGLDSRLISSVLKNGGFNYHFLHFPLFGPDKKIAYLIAEGLKKEIELQEDKEPFNDYSRYYGEFDYCFNFFNHHANPRRKITNRLQFTGAWGESIDLPEFYSDERVNLRHNPKLEVLLKELTIGSNSKILGHKMQEKWMNYIVGYFNSFGIPIGKDLSEKEQMDFYWLLVLYLVISRTISAYEAHNDRYSIFSEWHFNYFVRNIAFSAKEGRRLTLALIKTFDPELASFPFISRVITAGSSVQETEALPIQYRLGTIGSLKSMMPDWMVEIYKIFRGVRFNKEYLAQIDFDTYADVVNVKRLQKYPGMYKTVLERLFSVEILRNKMQIMMQNSL